MSLLLFEIFSLKMNTGLNSDEPIFKALFTSFQKVIPSKLASTDSSSVEKKFFMFVNKMKSLRVKTGLLSGLSINSIF